MDELLELELNKKSDEFHSRIFILLAEIEHCNFLLDQKVVINHFHNLKLLINEFEPLPSLLDDHLQSYIDQLTNLYLIQYQESLNLSYLTNLIGETIYNLSKIRGFKVITNYFSSDIYIIPKIINLLSFLSNDNEIFLNLIWLSNLVLVPFNLDLIQPDLTKTLFDLSISILESHSNASKNQLVSLILISRLITRSDLVKEYVNKYFHLLQSKWDTLNGAVKSGHLLTINKVLKKCPPEKLAQYLPLLNEFISQDLILFHGESDFTNLNMLYMIKVSSKLSKIHIFNQNYVELSSTINYLIHDIMNYMNDQFDTTLRYAMAKSISSICLNLKPLAANYMCQLIEYLLDQLEINFSTSFLSVSIGKINFPKYHTILLFLGYTALQKTLPLKLVPQVLSLVHKTIFIEQQRFNYTVGSQLRDSSCFIIWSLCRFLKKDQFQLLASENEYMMQTIFFDLILVTILDSDLILRRCGIAVTQEFIGRYGNLLFTHGCPEEIGSFVISFVGLFNNKAVGSHSESYALISELVNLGFNKNLFIPVLIQKIGSQEVKFDTKVLSSRYLKRLMSTDQEKFFNFKVKDAQEFTSDKIFESLLKVENSMYFVSDVLKIEKNVNAMNAVSEQASAFAFKWNSDSTEKALGYLSFILMIDLDYLTIDYWSVFKEILRHNDPRLIETLRLIFLKLKKIESEMFLNLLGLLKRNNLILSQSMFYLNCLSEEQIEEVFAVLFSNADCDIKANLIVCFQTQYSSYQYIALDRLLELLDDYTITNQGDVGSKVRYSSLMCLKSHGANIGNTDLLIQKLIRLSGETFDRIKFEAFSFITNEEGLLDLSIGDYYKKLFNNYSKLGDELRIPFWRGVCFSIGALTANSSLINESFREFLRFFIGLKESEKLDVLNKFIQLLKVEGKVSDQSARQLSLYNVVLNTSVKLFESSVEIPSDFSYQNLFTRSYNLHINTKNVVRIGLVLKLFQYIGKSKANELHSKVKQRLVWLCTNHPIETVRLMASEALFEILNLSEARSAHLVADIDWLLNPKELRFKAADIHKLLT